MNLTNDVEDYPDLYLHPDEFVWSICKTVLESKGIDRIYIERLQNHIMIWVKPSPIFGFSFVRRYLSKWKAKIKSHETCAQCPCIDIQSLAWNPSYDDVEPLRYEDLYQSWDETYAQKVEYQLTHSSETSQDILHQILGFV